MTGKRSHSWQSVHALLCERIDDQTWPPGELIPGEVELADQFGCARTTVNRALRELAAAGVIDRKRKAGTRVAKLRTRKATAEIPVIKTQVERAGKQYDFSIVKKRDSVAPRRVSTRLNLSASHRALHVRTIHYADTKPFVFEDRWINYAVVPEVMTIDFDAISVNEWLVRQVPFSAGQLRISAQSASKAVANALGISPGAAVLFGERQTWLAGASVTLAGMYYPPEFSMEFEF